MIQDIAPMELDLSYSLEGPTPDDIVLAFDDRRVLSRVDDEGMLHLPRVRDLADGAPGTFVPSFRCAGERLRVWPSADLGLKGFELLPISVFRTAEPKWMCFAGLTGHHLHLWYSANRFCGCCGAPTRAYSAERALECPSCGHLEYPRIAPAVIIGLTDGERIMTSRYAGRPYKGRALLAGFIEVGETPEQAVVREVAEEVGLAVRDVRYAGSQPWGMSGDLLLGYWCSLDGTDEVTIDERELASAEWVRREDIEPVPNRRTLTFDMIERFRLGQEYR